MNLKMNFKIGGRIRLVKKKITNTYKNTSEYDLVGQEKAVGFLLTVA